MTPGEVAQHQLDAYNTQNLDRFCACYTEDVVVADYRGAESSVGLGALRARYGKLFAENPENHVVLLGRMAVGNVVIDHEEVRRSRSAAPFYVIAIYTVSNGKIARAEFVRAQ